MDKPIINIIFDDLNQRIKNIGEKCLNFQEENKNLKEQLARKTQECEELKKECNEYFELMAIRTEVLAKIAIKLGINTAIIENKEIFNKIGQLKAENEELKKQNNQFDNGINEQFSKIIELEGRNNLLKQVLTEIKEIAENYTKRNYADFKFALQEILQKISECEVE